MKSREELRWYFKESGIDFVDAKYRVNNPGHILPVWIVSDRGGVAAAIALLALEYACENTEFEPDIKLYEESWS